jgi:hypothetical protein
MVTPSSRQWRRDGDLVLRQSRPDDLDPLAEPADPLGHRHPKMRELLGPVAEPDPSRNRRR